MYNISKALYTGIEGQFKEFSRWILTLSNVTLSSKMKVHYIVKS